MKQILGLGLLTWLVAPQSASAYCSAHACDPDSQGGQRCQRDAHTGCPIEGPALSRPDGCVYFAVQEGAAQRTLGLSDTEFEEIVADAFAAWGNVDCGDGRKPAVTAMSLGSVRTDAPFACDGPRNSNVDAWLIETDLSVMQAVSAATGATAGVTHVKFHKPSGEIYDSDVSLNWLWLSVQPAEEVVDSLRAVVLHEAGHVLGLAHSQDKNALMYREYSPGDIGFLTQDDVDGVCELFPPGSLSCPVPDEAPSSAVSAAACRRLGAPVGSRPPRRLVINFNQGAVTDAGVVFQPELWGGDSKVGCTVGHPGAHGNAGWIPWGTSIAALLGTVWRQRRRRATPPRPPARDGLHRRALRTGLHHNTTGWALAQPRWQPRCGHPLFRKLLSR